MNKDNVYKYFVLEAELHNSIMNMIRDIRKNTKYDNLPYRIDKINNAGNGLISFTVVYYIELGDHEVVDYSFPIEDLERY